MKDKQAQTYIVYLVVNKLNGKVYVGKTSKSLAWRWREHWVAAYGPKKRKTYFWRALRKWGPDNFDVCVIDVTESLQESSELEIKYIAAFESCNPRIGYNLSLGGEGVHPNEATKQKLSRSLKGRRWWDEKGVPHPRLGLPMNEKTRKAMDRTGVPCSEWSKEVTRARKGPLNAVFGTHKTAEQKKAMSELRRGVPLTEEWKRNISEAGKGRVWTPEARKNGSDAKLGEKNPMFGVTGVRHHNYRQSITYELVKPMLESGMSTNQIAKQLGVTRKVVKARLDGGPSGRPE